MSVSSSNSLISPEETLIIDEVQASTISENVLEDAATYITVSSDQLDYAPGSVAVFTAENVSVGGIVEFNVVDTNLTDGVVSNTSMPWKITDGGEGDLDATANGYVITSWNVNQDAAGQSFILTATDLITGNKSESAFTDSPPKSNVSLLSVPNSNTSPLVNLTAAQSIGQVNGALFQEVTGSGDGSGQFLSFLRINGASNDTDRSASTEEGFNTDGTVSNNQSPLDDINGIHTHAIQLDDVPLVTVNGVQYREFLLDLGESSAGQSPYLSLDSLQIYVGGGLDKATTIDRPQQQDGTASIGLSGGTLVYDLDGGSAGDGWIALKDLNAGNGQVNYRVLIPESNFVAAGATLSSNVVLYSAFGYQGANTADGTGYSAGTNFGQDGTFEEWGVDPTHLPAHPGIDIDKVTVDGSTSGDGLTVISGETIIWRYTVTNTGDVPLSNISVLDDQGEIPAYASGDTNADGKLDTTETWIFEASGTASSGEYSNIGTASASFTDDAGHSRVAEASDDSSYLGVTPSIAIQKVTVDGTFAGDGIKVLAGEEIVWRYNVTTDGRVDLSNVQLTDNQGVVPVLVGGDTNSDGLLNPGETWVYEGKGVAIEGAYSNHVDVTADFTDTAGHVGQASAWDASNYLGITPSIAINKVTVDGTTSGDGLTVLSGEAIAWRYEVTNTSGVALSSVMVSDSVAGVIPVYASGDTNADGKLDTTETWIFEASGTASSGEYSNIGTASASFTDDAGHSRVAEASDDSSYLGVTPSIAIQKVTVDGTFAGDGIKVLAGEEIVWRYNVTTDGRVDLSNVQLTDNQGVVPVLVGGDTNSDGLLNPGETWVYEGKGVAIEGAYSNHVDVTADFTDTAGHVGQASAWDASNYLGITPSIAINKVTVDGTTSGDGLTVLSGEAIAWRYEVTNTSGVALSSVMVSDSVAGVIPVYASGDTNADGKLDTTETWIFEASGTASSGEYSNIGTASASFTDDAGHSRVAEASDDSSYLGVTPSIAIQKVTVDGTFAGDGIKVLAGEEIVWRYNVTTDGRVDLSNVQLTDNQGVVPVLVGGDTNSDGLLNPGETWVYEGKGVAIEGAYSNHVDVTADFTDTAGHVGQASAWDASNYLGITPSIAINKVTVDGTTSGDGLTVLSGEAIAWRYEVTNTSGVALSSVMVSDSVAGVIPVYASGDTNADGKLDTTETWIFEASGTASSGEYSNIGTASASFTDDAGHSRVAEASDDSSYLGVTPSIEIDKVTTGYTSPTSQSTGDGQNILAGYDVKWTYHITNGSGIELNNISVSDSVAGVSPTAVLNADLVHNTGDVDMDGKLDVNETWVYEASGTAVFGSYSNTGIATGDLTDSAGHTLTAVDEDDSSYVGYFDEIGFAWSKGFWSQRLEAWDGKLAFNKQGMVDTQNLLNGNVLSKLDVLPDAMDATPSNDWNKDGSTKTDGSDTGILLGDSNGNGKVDLGEETLFVTLAAARQIISSSESTTDARQILMSQALAAQLNIYNGSGQPNDLITEAVRWLEGKSPYAYSDGSTGNVDTDQNGVLDQSEYNLGTKAFTFDANGSLAGTALSPKLQAWQKFVDVNTGELSWGSAEASGEGLKNGLMYFNNGYLVVTGSSQVGWDSDGISGASTVTNIHINSNDNFWATLHEVDTNVTLTGIQHIAGIA